MYDDDSLESLNPSVTTESNSNEAYNSELSEQTGLPITGGDKTLYSREPGDAENPETSSEAPSESVPQQSPPSSSDGSITFTKQEADELRSYIRAQQMHMSELQRSSLEREKALNNFLINGHNQQAQPSAAVPHNAVPPAPPSEYEQSRNKYLSYLSSLYGPARANQMLAAQDEYNKAYFKNSFDSSMSGYNQYFERAKQQEYTENLDNMAEKWVKKFSDSGSLAGLTPVDCRRLVFANMKAYIDSGHTDIEDINNWVAQNSTTMLMAAADEKRKMLLENARRQGATRNSNVPNAPNANSVPSTTAARNMVSTGDDARMRVDAGVTGGASAPMSDSQQTVQSTLDSLARQTGLRFKNNIS